MFYVSSVRVCRKPYGMPHDSIPQIILGLLQLPFILHHIGPCICVVKAPVFQGPSLGDLLNGLQLKKDCYPLFCVDLLMTFVLSWHHGGL